MTNTRHISIKSQTQGKHTAFIHEEYPFPRKTLFATFEVLSVVWMKTEDFLVCKAALTGQRADPERGGTTALRNVGNYLQVNKALRTIILEASKYFLWHVRQIHE
jgi:hypothetical protein